MIFILMRLAGYVAVFTGVMALRGLPWWQWLLGLAAVAWGTWDACKRPDDPAPRLRLGVWVEWAVVMAWALLVRDRSVLFLLVSPMMRTCVHLSARDVAAVGAASALGILGLNALAPAQAVWLQWGPAGALVALTPYTYVLGRLLAERDEARRQVAVAALEQEQRLKDEERVRMARQLHDVMGQYWTAVIRGLDVALVTQGEQQRVFIQRAQEAAMQGLQEMRTAVHDWNDGRQTPNQWIGYLEAAVERFRETVGVEVRMAPVAVAWERFADPVIAAEALARTVVEALTNAVRHGAATTVTIGVATDADGVTALVQDNGRGVGGQGAKPGVGVRSMEGLAAMCGGTWRIESGRGATVTLWLPYAGRGR